MPLINVLEEALDEYSEDCALIDRSGKLTFAQVRRRVDGIFEMLKRKGCQKGDRVAALTLNCSQAVMLEWATYKLGGIWIGIPWRERKMENVIGILKACSPKLLFIDPAALNPTDLRFLLKSPDLGLKKEGWLRDLVYFRLRWGSCRGREMGMAE